MFNEVLTLVKDTVTVDAYGDTQKIHKERKVFCDVKSISQSEFYQSHTAGLKPEIKFILPDVLEYDNEKIVKYKRFQGEEREYKVVRTYQNGNELEIVCSRGVDE